MYPHVKAAAFQLRESIEFGFDAQSVATSVLNLVDALGGNPTFVRELVGKPELLTAYLVSLILTQPD